MFSLPTLAPQDSYPLWYYVSNPKSDNSRHPDNGSFDGPATGQNGVSNHHRRQQFHRSPLARLRLDEEYMERRKLNVQNYGNSWIKPPGIPKSLYQLREEKREMEEHQEALRREQLAQELAEAEAAEGNDELLQGEGLDVEEEVRDLDDEVPDADTTGMNEEDDSENEDFEDEDEDEVEEVPRGVLASRMPEYLYREALVRGEPVTDNRFGDEGGSTIDEEDPSQMLQEEDLVPEGGQHMDLDMDMDADLDAEVPEAETGGYEHTDTEDELSSSEDGSVEEHYPQRNPAASSMVRSDGTQNSMDLGSILSTGSSQQGSSPQNFRGQRNPRH